MDDLLNGVGLEGVHGRGEVREEADDERYERDVGAKQPGRTVPVKVFHVLEPQILKYEKHKTHDLLLPW